MTLKILPLKNAFLSLTKALNRAMQNREDLEVRDGCIQRFEYTYELSIKLIKRYLEEESPSTENIDQSNFRDLLRIAIEVGLIQKADSWFSFREARNNTSHAYNETKAIAVFNVIPEFVKHIQFLILELEKRIDKNDTP